MVGVLLMFYSTAIGLSVTIAGFFFACLLDVSKNCSFWGDKEDK